MSMDRELQEEVSVGKDEAPKAQSPKVDLDH
jgi:hypothetical protein